MEPQISAESAGKMAQQVVAKDVPGYSSVGGLEEKAIEAVQAGRGEEFLKMITGEIIPYKEGDVLGVLTENLSSKPRRADGGREEPDAGTREADRYNAAKEVALNCLNYLTKGEGDPPDVLTDAVVDYLAQNPAFREVIFDSSSGSPTRRTEAKIIAKNLLKQPEVRRKIYTLFVQRLDPSKGLPSASDVSRLERELTELSSQVILTSEGEISNAIQNANRDIQQKKTEIVADPNYSEYFMKRHNLLTIESVIKDIQEGKMSSRSDNWTSLRARLRSSIMRDIAADDTPQSALSKLIQFKLRTEHELQTHGSFAEIRNKEKEIIDLEKKVAQLNREKDRVTSEENKKLLAEYRGKKQQLEEKRALLTVERITYAAQVVAIPKEAVKEYLDEVLSKAGSIYKTKAVEEAQKNEQEGQRILSVAVEKLGTCLGRRKVDRGGETRFLPDKREARKKLNLLIGSGGVQAFMQAVTSNVATLTEYGLNDPEVNALLGKMSDPEFVKTTGIQLAKKVLADYLLAGGRLSRDDIIAMTDREWMKDLLNDGLKIAKEKREQIKQLLGQDVLTKFDEIKQGKSTGEWLKANWWKFGLGILAILLLLGLGGQKLLTA